MLYVLFFINYSTPKTIAKNDTIRIRNYTFIPFCYILHYIFFKPFISIERYKNLNAL